MTLGSVLGFWKLNGDAADSSGNNHHGTKSQVFFREAAFGQIGCSFNKKPFGEARVLISSHALLANIFDAGGTVTFWVKHTGPGVNSTPTALWKGGLGAGWWMYVSGAVVFLQDFSTTAGVWGVTGNAVPANEWHHVALVYDADAVGNNPDIYIDGVSKTVTESTTPVGTRTTDSGETLNLGGFPGGLGSNMTGMMFDVRIYDEPATAAEINAIVAAYPYPVNRSKGHKEIRTKWPVEEGLTARTQKQVGQRWLHPEGLHGKKTTVKSDDQVGMGRND